jgi:hypothetical protein
MVFARSPLVRAILLIALCLTDFYLGFPAKKVRNDLSPAPNRPGFDGPAELPRVYVKSSLADTPAPGRVIKLKEGSKLNDAINEANCGDTIALQAGATFPGEFKLPAKKCDDDHWVIIRTDAPDSALPPEGTRITPCYAGVASLPGRPDFHCSSTKNVMAKIIFTANGSGPFTFLNGANHYRFIGLEVTRDSPGAVIYNLFLPERDGSLDHIVYDRVWLHGTAQDETNRGIALGGSSYVAVVDSFFTDFHCTAITGSCVDAQAIAGGVGSYPMGPYKIVNNFMEGAAETIIFGGGPATYAPADIEIRRNYMYKPPNWRPGSAQFIGAANGRPFIVKNLFELKNATRVLLDGNVLENSWGGFSQQGFGILLTPKNQAGRGGNICPECYVTDVTIRNCRISHVASGFQIANGISATGGSPKAGARYSIHDIVVDDVQDQLYRGSGTFAQISMTEGVSETPTLHDVQIDHVSAFPKKSLLIVGGPIQDPRMSNLTITNSIFTFADKSIITTGGGPLKNCSAQPDSKGFKVVFDECFASYGFHHNVIVGSGDFPKGNATPKKPADIGFANFKDGAGGDYHLASKSKYRHAGTDGKDLGADIDAIEKATAGVE